MRAIVLGGTKGIGKSISKYLNNVCDEVLSFGSKDVDTTSIESVKKFTQKYKYTNVLVLNTGGPPDMKFDDITDKIWLENFNRLFLSFVNLVKEIKVKKNGYIFLVSSFIIKQPDTDLIMSSSLRSGFVSLFKSLSKIKKKEKISFINIAPGPIKTQRLINLLKKEKKTLKSFSKEMPGNIIPEPKEIGLFVEFIVKNKIKSLNGLTIPFDSGMLQSI